MSKFAKVLGEAKANGGPLLSLLEKVAPTLALQVKNSKTVEGALSLMTDAFAKLPDVQRRAELSTAAFGRSGQQLGEWMHQGRGAIQGQMLEYLRLAGSQEAFARGSSDLDNELRKTETAFTGLRSAALSPLLPVFGRLADRVTGFLVANRDGLAKWADGAAASIESWVRGGGLERLSDSLGRFADGVKQAWDFIGGFKGAAVGLGLYLGGPLITSVVALVPAFAELGIALLSTPVGWFTLAVGAIALAGVGILTDWKPVKGFFHEFFPQLTKDVEDAVAGIKMLASGIQKLIDLKNELKASAEAAGGWKKDLSDATGGYGFNPLSLIGLAPAVDYNAPSRAMSAKLQVEFKNAPGGTRISSPESSPNMSIDTSTGYANASF
jgi:hypothetical protein